MHQPMRGLNNPEKQLYMGSEEVLSYDFAEDSLALRRWDDDAMASGAYLYYKRCSRVNASNA